MKGGSAFERGGWEGEYSFTRLGNSRARSALGDVQVAPHGLEWIVDACFEAMNSQGVPTDRPKRLPEAAAYLLVARTRADDRGRGELMLVVAGPRRTLSEVAESYDVECGVRLQAGASARLFAVPAEELTERAIPLRDLWGDRADQLLFAVSSARSPGERWELIHAAVRRFLVEQGRGSSAGVRLAAAVRRAPGDARLGSVARDLGFTVRTLERRFRREVGLTPKEYQRIARMAGLMSALASGRCDWSDMAVTCGYYDQPHMIDDCQRVLGRSPENFVRAVECRASLSAGFVFEKAEGLTRSGEAGRRNFFVGQSAPARAGT